LVRLFFQLIFALVAISITAQPAGALIIPPDPFDATDRYALLFMESDGSITTVQVKVKAPEPALLGPGKIIAQIRYKLPLGISPQGTKTFYFSASQPVPVQALGHETPVITTFDFTREPVPSKAYYRSMEIFFLNPDAKTSTVPQRIANYSPEQLLVRSKESIAQTQVVPSDTAVSGGLLLGPVTILRERGTPQIETISITAPDPMGTFMLQLTNGDSAGQSRVSAALITLNGQQLFRPSELNRKVAGLNRQVTLLAGENILQVELRSEPGSFITAELFQQDSRICRAFGPRTFIRATGKPVTETLSFSPSSQLTGPFTLHLTNGQPDGTNRVDTGTVILNGLVVADSSRFNENVVEFSQTVSIQTTNALQVQLQGAPGDRLTIEIMGFDAMAPHVTISSPVSGAIYSAVPITVTGTVDDPSATVTVNGTMAIVSPDGTFTAEGVPLQEGENTLTVVATDSCGNQGEDQVSVRFQTVPVGPELTLCAEPFREQTPHPPGDECATEALGHFIGFVTGQVDETAASITLNGVLLPDGVEVFEDGPISDGLREGTFFWAFVNLPQVDGLHPFTAVAANALGEQQTATVNFHRDSVPPHLAITAPQTGIFFNTSTVTVSGTVDDPEATVRLGYFGQVIPVSNGIFQTTVNLAIEGTNTIMISARDPSGNTSYATIQIARDTISPTVTILTPQTDSAVNTPVVSVQGTITDQNPVAATITVNASPPQPITLSAIDYSNTVTLESGMNTILVEAIDAAGNREMATSTILMDTTPPMVSITAPEAGAQLSGVVSVTADVSDTLSGVSQVELLANGANVTGLTTAPYYFSLNTALLSAGETALTVHAVDHVGNSAESSVVVNVLGGQIAFQITSPAVDETIAQSPILIKGILKRNDSMPITEEVGIVVNGYPAQFQGTEFGVEGISLEPGVHTLTATAYGDNGVIASTSIEADFAPGEPDTPSLSLNVLPSCVEFPSSSTVTFTTDEALPYPIVSYQLDTDGDGVTDVESQTFGEVSYTYTNPGLYFPTLTAIDSKGNLLTAATMVNVLNQSVVDNLLRANWTMMVDKLSNGDTTTALNQIATEARPNYETMFNLLQDQLPLIMSTSREFNFLSLTCGSARYELVTEESGGTYSYEVLFSKDTNGLWKIRSF
jgi:Glucodextranase, domain B/Bacterial Ig domain